jgi:hypothetical protein
MIDSACATADCWVEIIVGVLQEESELYSTIPHVVVPEWSTVMSWNFLADSKAEGHLIMLGSDDMVFATPGWGTALLNHYNALENKIHVYHLQDSRDADGSPHPIISREYIAAMGYFLPPVFYHWYVDSWTRKIAEANGCFSYFKDYQLIHDKPSDVGKADETHNRIRKQGWHERDSYVNQKCQHFLEYEKSRLAEAMAAV